MSYKIKKLNNKFHQDFFFGAKQKKLYESPNYELIESIYIEGADSKPKTHFIVKEKGMFGEEVGRTNKEKSAFKIFKNAEKEKPKIETKFLMKL